MSISWCQIYKDPPYEIFQLEKEIFGDKYISCPKSYQDFLKFFRYDYLQVTLKINMDIVGLLLADELIEDTLYYLRLIGVKANFRNKGLGSKLFLNFIKSIKINSNIAYVSNNEVLHRIIRSVKGLKFPTFIDKNIHEKLCSYNSKLCEVNPMQRLDCYYQLKPSGDSDAFFYYLNKGKEI